MRARPRRAGFAMLSVLFVLALVAIMAGAVATDGQVALDGAHYRMGATRARWLASGCHAVLRARMDSLLASAPEGAARDAVWRHLDRQVAEQRLDVPCGIRLRAAGTRLDTAEPERLALLHASDSVIAARLDIADNLLRHILNRRHALPEPVTIRDLLAGGDSALQVTAAQHYATIASVATLDPDAWMAMATVTDLRTGTHVTVEHRLTRTLRSVDVTRERQW